MNTSVIQPRPQPASFLEGVLLALIAATAAAVLHSVLPLVLGASPALSLNLITTLLALGYLLYLLGRTAAPAGRLVSAVLWMLITAGCWALSPSPWTLMLVQAAGLWLVRALYFQSSMLGALLDLGLMLAGLATALWAAMHSGSVFLAVWCLFLIQALFVLLPSAPVAPREPCEQSRSFDQARRVAEAALARLDETGASL